MLVTKYETKIRELHATRPRSTSVRVRTFQDFARKQPCRGKLPRVIEQTSGLFSLLLRTRVPFPCRERHLGGPISSIFVRELPPGGPHSLLGVQAATDPWWCSMCGTKKSVLAGWCLMLVPLERIDDARTWWRIQWICYFFLFFPFHLLLWSFFCIPASSMW